MKIRPALRREPPQGKTLSTSCRRESRKPKSSVSLLWRTWCLRHSNRHASRNTWKRKMRSKIRWFTEFCNSHYVSQFAAFFIDARAKRSTVKSCLMFRIFVLLSALKKWVLMVEKGLKKLCLNIPPPPSEKEFGGTKPFSVHIGVLIESFFWIW